MIMQKKAERRRRRKAEAKSSALHQEQTNEYPPDFPPEHPVNENVHTSPKRPSPQAAQKYGYIGDQAGYHHSGRFKLILIL